MIWFIGDTHFYDPHPAVFANQYLRKNYRSIQEYSNSMDTRLMSSWKDLVSDDDTVYHLGDVGSFCNIDEAKTIISGLKGNKILIMGNHDMERLDTRTPWGSEGEAVSFWREVGFCEVIPPSAQPYVYHNQKRGISIHMCHVPPMFINPPEFYVFAHVHMQAHYRTVSANHMCVSAERMNFAPISLSEIMVCRERESRDMMYDSSYRHDILDRTYIR